MNKTIQHILLQRLLTLFIISVLSFLVVKLAPGKPSQIDVMNPRFTKADIARFHKAFDLDKPLYTQYYLFYKKMFTGTLVSFKDNQSVLGKIWDRFLNSLPLFIVGTLITWALAFPTGIYAALNRGKIRDRTITVLAYALISLPSFVLAYFFIVFIVKTLHLPVLGMYTFGREHAGLFASLQDRLWHIAILSVMSAITGIAVLSRYVREQMLEVIEEDYIRTAKAKGATDASVYYEHALRNALLPFVTLFGLLLPELIGGSVIIESIFAWPGMGRLGYEAILARDYPVIISLNFISAVLVLAGTLVSDLLYRVADPRIRN